MQVVSRPTGDRESLECLLPLDTHALTNEQSIITDEELRDAAGPAAIKSSKVSFAGTAAQKPSWIARPAPSVDDEEMDDGSDDASDDGSEDESQDGSDDESEEHGDIDGDDHDFGADDEDMTDEQQQEERTRLSSCVVYSAFFTALYSELESYLMFVCVSELRRLERDEMEFPDEVETPLDMPARERFARYRGLENFRTSPWDIYESLPVEYGRVAQFEDFEATAKAVLAGEDSLTRAAYFFGLNGVGDEMQTDPLEPGTSAYFAALQAKATELGQPNLAAGFALPGSYVTLHVANVSTAVAQRVAENAKRGAPLLASGLFAFEHKVTVMQYRLRRHPEYQDPIKGKEQMVFHVGMRRFPARPIYSDDAKHNGKHMCEKFLQLGRFAAASIYAPVSFPPAPVLAFKPTEDGRAHPLPLMMDSGTLVATGTTLHADPFRLNIKRIILTGYPMRVHKRHAVVRYMFFSAEDTKWFMPVKLRTKFGLIGQIRETLGTKGHFKCAFNDFIKQNDTICMHLYKRQFPKWVPEYWE
jgi:pre-rRNA-processing protein TSR1